MIDIENKIFDTVKTALVAQYPDIVVYSDYTAAPSKFPCVFLVEDGNTTLERTAIENQENHARITYTVNVYTNNASGRKTLAKDIAKLIDDVFIGLKFSRSMMNKLPNIDESIYRITSRYTAVVGKPVVSGSGSSTTYRYQIYKA